MLIVNFPKHYGQNTEKTSTEGTVTHIRIRIGERTTRREAQRVALAVFRQFTTTTETDTTLNGNTLTDRTQSNNDTDNTFSIKQASFNVSF